jgi:hypothetical protein
MFNWWGKKKKMKKIRLRLQEIEILMEQCRVQIQRSPYNSKTRPHFELEALLIEKEQLERQLFAK